MGIAARKRCTVMPWSCGGISPDTRNDVNVCPEKRKLPGERTGVLGSLPLETEGQITQKSSD